MTQNEQNWLNNDIKNLASVFLKMKKEDEVLSFLRDICTIKELKSLAERWKVCNLLEEWFSYRKINEITWVSTTTITRVAHWVKYWEWGYQNILKLNKKK